MSSSAKNLSSIDRMTTYTVIGFIRRYQTMLESFSDMALFKNIPPIGPNATQISEDGLTATHIETSLDFNLFGTTFGAMNILSTSKAYCKWKIKAICAGIRDTGEDEVDAIDKDIMLITVGITSIYDVNRTFTNDDDNGRLGDGYGYGIKGFSGGTIIAKPNEVGGWNECGSKGIKVNDIITIILDLPNKQIRVIMPDEKEETVSFHNIEINQQITYRLAIEMFIKDTAVSILEFTEEHFCP